MSTLSHEPSGVVQKKPRWVVRLDLPEMWTSLAIGFIWLSVLLDALFGPNIVTASAGGDSSTVPSAVVLTVFATIATWVIARYGFRQRARDN